MFLGGIQGFWPLISFSVTNSTSIFHVNGWLFSELSLGTLRTGCDSTVLWLVNCYGLDFYNNYSLEGGYCEFYYYMNYWKDRPVFFESELCSLQLCDLKVTYLLRPQMHHLSMGILQSSSLQCCEDHHWALYLVEAEGMLIPSLCILLESISPELWLNDFRNCFLPSWHYI